MNFGAKSKKALDAGGRPIGRVRGMAPLAQRAMKKPAVVGYILLTARRAQIALAMAIVLISFLVLPPLNTKLDKMYPPKTSTKLFGLIKKNQQNPQRERAGRRAAAVLWMISGSIVIMLVWFHIPEGVAGAMALAKKRERRGDELLSSQPEAGLRFYRQALALTCDLQYEKALLGKMAQLETTRIQKIGDRPEALKTAPGSTAIITRQGSTSGDCAGEEAANQTVVAGGRYRVEREIGKGGMGAVYRGWDTVLERPVALKKLAERLTGDEDCLSRFCREAKALARLTHPSIVQVYDLVEEGGDIWMALEYAGGGDLAEYLRSKTRLTVIEAVQTMTPIADGLAYAHGQGVVHRDLKPSNILLTESRLPKISDFGLAKFAASSVVTQEGTILGSPRYMSPEQAAGRESDERSDIYSFGITFYEVLAGQPPFDGDTARVMAQHITQPPPPLGAMVAGVPLEVEHLIMGMLAKQPDQRPAGMAAVVQTLNSIMTDIKPVSELS